MDRRRFLGLVPLVAASPVAVAASYAGGEATPAKMVFTSDEVKSLNAFQRSRVRHPYTCCKNNRDRNHLDGEGVLVATERGWVCLYCDYIQESAAPWMKDWRWKEMCVLELEMMRRERRGRKNAFACGRRRCL